MASLIGALAQLVERFAGSEEVSGSNPLGSTSFKNDRPGACRILKLPQGKTTGRGTISRKTTKRWRLTFEAPQSSNLR